MGPAMVGHSHPAVVDAIQKQAAQLVSTRITLDNVPLIELCTKLAAISPLESTKTYICSGGGEANEAAIKIAMLATGRDGVVSLTGAYHGQSIGTMSLCGMPGLRDRIPPRLRMPSYQQVVSGDPYRTWPEATIGWRDALAYLDASADQEGIAAFIIEPVQGVAGHVVFEPGFYHAVRQLCRKHGIILIADEVQTALGRCGALWASVLHDLAPDIITVGKAFGGGLPFGAALVRGDLARHVENAPFHLLTAQGNPVVCAAALAVIGVVENEGLVERSQHLGAVATGYFQDLAKRCAVIGDVRGPGLYVGVDLVVNRATREPATAACDAARDYALQQGLIVEFGGLGANVFKLKPPLTVSDEIFERMLAGAGQVMAFVDNHVQDGRRSTA
jgi:4-aminobutyrate aminotransferase-like enzyme